MWPIGTCCVYCYETAHVRLLGLIYYRGAFMFRFLETSFSFHSEFLQNVCLLEAAICSQTVSVSVKGHLSPGQFTLFSVSPQYGGERVSHAALEEQWHAGLSAGIRWPHRQTSLPHADEHWTSEMWVLSSTMLFSVTFLCSIASGIRACGSHMFNVFVHSIIHPQRCQ